ncbi:MAG: selenocysteine lyase/cysteine desulfurase [Thermoproteota archaeon]|jgi:selenocysteine lyase/cysteine desulfurase
MVDAAILPLSTAEVAQLRANTPGADNVVHLNHAGSSLPTQATLDTQIHHLQREAMTGGYEAANEAADRSERVYASIGSLIGAKHYEIARLEQATAAWNAGFWSIPMEPGQRIITANAAYGANAVAFLRAVERRGVTIDVVGDDEHGHVDVDELARRVDSDVALIAVTHVPTNGGLVNPAAAVGKIANGAKIPYLLDACQSVGHLHLDVNEIGCDLLSGTGRKFLRGPRGTGFLYASERIIERLIPDHPDHHGADWTTPSNYVLQPNARRFESWEFGHGGWLGLGNAVDEALTIGTERIEATIYERSDSLRKQLRAAGFTLWDLGARPCGIVTATGDGLDPSTAKLALRAQDINISVTTPASTRFDSANRDLPDMMRISAHYTTTEAEIRHAVSALSAL